MQLEPLWIEGIEPLRILTTPEFPITPYTLFFLENFPPVKDHVVLDFGTGNGVFSIAACKKGARNVIAIDIRQESASLVKDNMQHNEVATIEWTENIDNRIQTIAESIDTILCNPSSIPIRNSEVPAYLDGGEFGNKMIFEMIAIAKRSLKKKGTLYFLHTSLVSRDATTTELTKQGFTYEIIDVREFKFRNIYANAIKTIIENKEQFRDIDIINRNGEFYEKVYFYKARKLQ